MKKEFKAFSFKANNIQDQDQYFVFEGYASTFNNIDLGDDIVVRGAFAESLAQTPEVPILLNHNMSELPVGMSFELYEDDKGLFVKAKLPKEDWRVSNEVMPQIKLGSVKEMSIGYYVKDYEMSKNGIRLLKQIILFEISLVTKAMNPLARVNSFKSFAGDIKLPLAPRDRSWDGTQAEQRIREYTDSIEAPNQDYKKYFMWLDGENADLFGSYKLLYADIINGKPYIVPRAIFAIAGILNGARGGVDISEADKNKIKPVINQLYKRMADEFNDDNIVSPLVKSFESLKDIETTLKANGFSNSEAKTLISKVKEFSGQRDVGLDSQRDVDTKQQVINNLNKFINNLK